MEIVEAAYRLRGMQTVRLPLQLLVGREGGCDFFEAQLPAERIPPRQQFQSAIADVFVTIGVIRVFTAAFPRRVFGNSDPCVKDPRMDQA